MIRQPVCAGTWYPTRKEEIEKFLDLSAKKNEAISCVCPHAGWMYSGKVAGAVYSRLVSYQTYILIGPNHTGFGPSASIYDEGIWQMPLGKIEIDTEISDEILKNSEFLKPDKQAHSREHCLEVQLPFIQYFSPSAKIVPIVLMCDEFEIIQDIGVAVSKAIRNFKNKKILIVASTDMTHYEPHEYAKKQDKLAIEKILSLDAEGLINTVIQRGISMCGVFPTACVILASKLLGAKRVELVKYATSGEVSGDYDAVVGYAGLIVM